MLKYMLNRSIERQKCKLIYLIGYIHRLLDLDSREIETSPINAADWDSIAVI
jgi:hypothetical protein